MPLRRLILLTVGAALIAAAPAAADTPLAAVDADTPIAAQGGWIAFSQQQDHGAYRLMLAHDGHVEAVPVDSARQPFDVTLGRDGAGRIVATYSRCDAHGHDCDVRSSPLSRRASSANSWQSCLSRCSLNAYDEYYRDAVTVY